MDLYTISFYMFAVLLLGSAIVVVFSRNIVRAAFALMITLLSIAAFYVLMMADFVGIVQLLLYVGGILVLILFGVMLTNRQISVDIREGAIQTIPAVIVTSTIGGILAGAIWSTAWPMREAARSVAATAPVIGEMFLTTYLLPFEVASVLLLVALVGAALIARRERKS
ncbi:MAG: NADH-quinone oxidoreductase subunit J [Bacteroidetes bacterium]|jgi:NADH-quinone oxidoreductase subunit J|nr:NADH-quinone oxidoreductase subunit J [Bacteroidota bacterium]